MRSLLLLLQLVSLVISNKICDPSYFDVTSDKGRVEYMAFTGEEPPDLWLFGEGGDDFFLECRVACVSIDGTCHRHYATGEQWACRLRPRQYLTNEQVAEATPFDSCNV
jgi:hypothetical protein